MDTDKTKIEKLRGSENWATWKFQLQILLDAKDALEVVTGDMTDPGEPAVGIGGAELRTHNEARAAYRKANKRAKELIVTTVEKKPLQLLVTCNDAKAMWDKLHGVYEQKSETSISTVQTQFYQYVKDESDDIATHISKVENIAERLRQLGEPIPDSMVMTKILNTLPSSFSHFASAWDSTPKAERTRDNLTARLLTEELRLQPSSSNSADESVALSTKANGHGKSWKQSRGPKGNKINGNGDIICYNCRGKGHISRNCPKPRTFKQQKQQKSSTNSYGQAFMMQTTTSDPEYDEENTWYVDTGATDHIAKYIEYFAEYEAFSTPWKVKVGNNAYINAKGRGTVNVSCLVNGKWHNNHITNVLFVPEIAHNLFSVSAATDKGFTYRAEKSKCVFLRGRKVVAVGEKLDKLYKLLIRVQLPEHTAVLMSQVDTLQLWHERLGHQNKRHVQQFLKIRGINVTVDDEYCDGCAFGKQHRQYFGQRIDKATAAGELVHSDVCGPMQEKSLGGARYFCVFKDDFTHFRRIYFLREKSDVKDKLKEYLSFVQTSTGNYVKALTTDGGKEYDNKEVREILAAAGIEHHKTAPYTPQQNGVAERENRFIVECARSMLHAKDLPIQLWAEAVNTAAYVLNRTGPSPTSGKTPYELWYGKTVKVDHLRVMGTPCYVHVPKEKRQKWDRKAEKGVLVGYVDDMSSYRVWIRERNEVIISHDVTFQGESLCASMQEVDSDASDAQNEELVPMDSAPEPRHRYNLRDKASIKQPDRMTLLTEAIVLLAECAEPLTYEEAVSAADSSKWNEAMKAEIESLHANNTWTLTELPPGRQAIDSKWVYKIKRNADGTTQRYKARLVARGFAQKAGIDYQETFCPVVRFETIRSLLSVAAKEKLLLAQFDVTTAFLNGNLDEEIYMKQPEGFADGSNNVCKLIKSLYGLKQAPRCWNETCTNFFLSQGLKESEADPCLYFRKSDGRKLLIALYVDDGIIAATHQEDIDTFLQAMSNQFDITRCGFECFLGIQVKIMQDGSIFISQNGYLKKILERFKMDQAKPCSTPMERDLSGEDDDRELESCMLYQAAVGSLQYLSNGTRPDITFAVNSVSKYLKSPRIKHWNMVKRIFRYLVGTMDYGILYRAADTPASLTIYSDADYAGDIDSRKSTSGYVSIYSGGAITWASQRQQSVSLSTTEAEFVAASQATKEAIWLNRLFDDIAREHEKPSLLMDNQSAIRLIHNQEFHKRSKHIEVRYFFVRDMVKRGDLKVKYVASDHQLADIFTKPLSKNKLWYFRDELGMCVV